MAIFYLVFSAGCGGNKPEPSPIPQIVHSVGDVSFNMRLAPDGLTFPTGLDDSGDATVERSFWIGETEVTYWLWYVVYTWATHEDRGVDRYYFANVGRQGSEGPIGSEPSIYRYKHPVTTVNYRDVIIWCNALTEYYNAQHGTSWNCVYTYDSQVLRDSRSTNAAAFDNVIAGENAEGFRLPTSMEWEMAARYRGNDSSDGAIERPAGSGHYWTPGNYASGARADYNNAAATQEAAWYSANSGSTQEVSWKPASGNGLGLYDMSGNVWEKCFDWHPTYELPARIERGGCWNLDPSYLQVGEVGYCIPSHVDNLRGFRLARTP